MPLDRDEGLCFDDDIDVIGTSLQEVTISFPDSGKPILKDISLDVPPGTSALIMGPAGSGKSTLMSLWAGIIEPTSGVVNFNGYSLQSLDVASLKKHIGYALSNNDIFLGTMLENITMGRPEITLDDVTRAIETVHLNEFIASLSEGLNTELDPEAKRLPRSVANKIILARAIVTRPKLLMLEDPLDHVPKNEKEEIIRNLTSSNAPWSIIVTSVDPLWAKYIPRKITLKYGEIIEQKKSK
jgi:ABC-type bacteriocin/lantibiotic exporter with double-glycine peptidase domain